MLGWNCVALKQYYSTIYLQNGPITFFNKNIVPAPFEHRKFIKSHVVYVYKHIKDILGIQM